MAVGRHFSVFKGETFSRGLAAAQEHTPCRETSLSPFSACLTPGCDSGSVVEDAQETWMAAGAKVLLIDDDEDFRASVRAPLEAQGYTVLEAESGDQGLKLLREQQPDAVLVDIMMESASEGYGVTQAIRWQEAYRDFRNLPIIMVSSIEETPDERFAMAGEVDMIRPDVYLTKPLDIPRLLDVLRKVTAPS